MNLRNLLLTLLLLILGSLQYRLWIGESSFAHVSSLNDRVDQLSAENSSKLQRNEILKAEIIDLKTGFAAIEERARVEWGLIKQGETFYLLLEQD